MFEKFYPDKEMNSAYEISYEKLFEDGKRGVIFDIDNTLVPHGEPADQRAKDLFVRLKKIGFQVVLLSNNKELRVKMFCDAVEGATYIYKAGKPQVKGYYEAMKRMNTNQDTTVFIGDQLFTDIWGAKNAGIYSILTKPIHPKEEIQIVFKRYLEKVILYFYHRKNHKKE